MASFEDTPARLKRASQMKCVGMDFDYFCDSSINGIEIELKNARDKLSDCHISEDDIKAYDEILNKIVQ